MRFWTRLFSRPEAEHDMIPAEEKHPTPADVTPVESPTIPDAAAASEERMDSIAKLDELTHQMEKQEVARVDLVIQAREQVSRLRELELQLQEIPPSTRRRRR